jgi:flagellar protein FlbT
VIRIDRKATVELLNDVTFLLETHVMQAKDATTLTRQIYFAVQIMLMDPTATATATPLARSRARYGARRLPHEGIDLGSEGRRALGRQGPKFRGDEGAAPPLSAGGP